MQARCSPASAGCTATAPLSTIISASRLSPNTRRYRWKQAVDKFPDWGLTFGNPDFVRYAESYGAIGHRVKRTDDLVPTIEGAFKDTGVHLITVPIDYVENTRVLVEELRGRVPEVA